MNNLKVIREEENLLQREMAQIMQTTQQQYSKIERGISDIYATNIKLLAMELNISADYIIGLIDEKKPLYGQNKQR